MYPTTIIANNIDYSTLVRDPRIPDEDCNVIEWEDHIGCEHDTTSRTTKVTSVSCAHRRYRFLSYGNGREHLMGVIPTLLKNLTYDQICHEHVTYYTISTFEKIIKKKWIKSFRF